MEENRSAAAHQVQLHTDTNVVAEEQQQELLPVLSDHAAKVRELREARRKRILARSSERLAYITAAAADHAINPKPLSTSSPSSAAHLLYDDDRTSEFCSFFSCCSSGDELLHAEKNLGVSSQDHRVEPSTREDKTKHEAVEVQRPSTKSTAVAMEAYNKADRETATLITSRIGFYSNFLSRLACVVLTALLFLVAGLRWGHSHHLDVPVLAFLVFVDLLYIVVAMSFTAMTGKARKANNTPATVLLQLLATLLLDSTIFACLLYGGFVVLPKVLSAN